MRLIPSTGLYSAKSNKCPTTHRFSVPQHTKYTVDELVANQKIVLHGPEARTLKYIPKVRPGAFKYIPKVGPGAVTVLTWIT